MTGEMQVIDRDYRSASGLEDRRYYKIFYSHIHRFPLFVLGQNPGGETDGTDMTASDSFFENWEHDYLRFRLTPEYALAGPASTLLSEVLATRSIDALRQVPTSNLIFRRSRNTGALNVSPNVAAEEARPFVSRLLKIVDPRCILLVSKTAYDLFVRHHCLTGSVVRDGVEIRTPNGRNAACIFLGATAYVPALDREVNILTIGHPSKYSSRPEWGSITALVKSRLESLGI
jgi:hypothetical protein